MIETNRIEFKECLTRELDIEKEVVAFLNYREGGILYIGIDRNGKVVGVEDIDSDMLKIKDRIRNNISPSPMGLFDVVAETIEGVKVIKVFVSSGTEKPYYKIQYGLSEKGCFIRVGTAAEPMNREMIDSLYLSRLHNSLKNIVSPRQDLTFTQLQIYYNSKGLHLNDNFLRTLDLLTSDDKLNYVAFLLADENSNSMKLAKYAGTDRCELTSNNEYGYCCLLTATQKVLDKLDVENKVSLRIMQSYSRENFEFGDNYVRMIVPFNWAEEKKDVHETGLKTGLKKRTAIDIQIVELIKENPTISYNSLAEQIGVARSGIARHLSNLQEANIIRRVGPAKGGHWEVEE